MRGYYFAKGRTSGFEITEVLFLEELRRQVFVRGIVPPGPIFHILNDDEENLFAFAFATANDNSTGVAHILEHSVLVVQALSLKGCLYRSGAGSLQTFLNAMTYPDKTVHPASSTNERDYATSCLFMPMRSSTRSW
ncbi:hypothetical protein MASR2M78_16880 [Treponema sp.]